MNFVAEKPYIFWNVEITLLNARSSAWTVDDCWSTDSNDWAQSVWYSLDR